MNGYAPNPSIASKDKAAPLTAGLLARKGEALPAVDADAHAGIDIAMRPLAPARGPVHAVSQNAMRAMYDGPEHAASASASRRETAKSGKCIALVRDAPSQETPENWTIIGTKKAQRPGRERRAQKSDAAGGRKATVTFRMPAKEFVRLRQAARQFDMTCQSILLDALDTYLDANDVAPVSSEDCKTELERLIKRMATKRRR